MENELVNKIIETYKGIRWYPRVGLRLALYAVVTLASIAVAGGCSGRNNDLPPPGYPVVSLSITPSNGGKSLDVLIDASTSTPGDYGEIIEWRFDFNGDGIDDYIETLTSASDGNSDGKTNHIYDTEGDYKPRVTIVDEGNNEDFDYDFVRVGFGAD